MKKFKFDDIMDMLFYKGEGPKPKGPYDTAPPLPEELIDKGPEPQHPYLVPIPKGYQYCNDCELFTPHTLNSQINPSKSMPEDFECDLCGGKSDGYYSCPRCGWEHDPDRDVSPVSIKDKKHIIACLNKQEHENDVDKRIEIWENCDCPEVDVYPVQKIFNYRSNTQHWNMECPNPVEWSYDIMCNACNYVFEVEDGNC